MSGYLTPLTLETEHIEDGPLSWVTLERVLAAAAMVCVGSRENIISGFTLGHVVAIALTPLWLPHLARFRGGALTFGLGLVTAIFGLLLSLHTAQTHAVNPTGRHFQTALLLGSLFSIGVILWARAHLRLSTVAVCYGLGMLASAVHHGSFSADNPWKSGFAVPVSVVLLALALRRTTFAPQMFAILLLAGVSAASGSRSYTATFVLGAVLLAWQRRPTHMSRRASWVWSGFGLVALSVAVYNVIASFLVEGLLGEAAQAKSVAQIDTGGSLILGGRPEIAATLALMKHHFMGYGVGIKASTDDLAVAKSAMLGINYDPDNGYVNTYMFGGPMELHSVIGDLWVNWGLMGLIFAMVALISVIHSFTQRIAHRNASALLIFLSVWTFWNYLFSPLYSAIPSLVLAVALVLPRRGDSFQSSWD